MRHLYFASYSISDYIVLKLAQVALEPILSLAVALKQL